MSLFPASEFTSLFRLLDDYDVHRSGRGTQTSTIRAFRPKFDIRELKDSYELHGELPGIEQKDVNLEFVDPHTLVITGRVERSSTQSNAPTGSIDQDQPAGRIASGEKPTSPKKATRNAEGSSAATEEPEYTYWVSERSVGEFHRSFTFPTRVNQDNVSASLKNGILSVVVPKQPAPVAKKIRID
jgi:HSP20 family protein